MNRFTLDPDPVVAAAYHCDKHVVKMILEEAQMLCTAHRLHGDVTPDLDAALYRATHQNHPCTIWARATRDNYLWGYRLLVALCDEYTHRYGKVHATARLLPILATVPIGITDTGLHPFPQAMPDECKTDDAVEAYRQYYIAYKSNFARWTKREVPSWYTV